ncbi:MAG: DEAD/DEAH box helicase [Acidobacteria bacterium]|nr:DEAD/DEAH box helicase [Acidobacteriota bacterium]
MKRPSGVAEDPLEAHFHPAVSAWFQGRFGEATQPQKLGWPVIQKGDHVLIAAPTGSGKTLAAFLCAIDRLVQQGVEGHLSNTTQVLYISPLKALANDVRKNLLEPLQEIRERASQMQLKIPEIRPLVRTGDTLGSERRRMIRKPPHILVTTPESLFILLTSESGQRMLQTVNTVIVDEIHALARDKRGSHLSLSLERLEVLTGKPFQRVGLSATQKPIEEIARFLTGVKGKAVVLDMGHQRHMELAVEVPPDELGAVASNEMWEEIYERLSNLIHQHRTTLIFVNTRRLAERVAYHLAERFEDDSIACHHGSLSRDIRLKTEERLKTGELKAVVATASLELGIDIGSVDLVCQIGSTRLISLALQRIGRSGHWKGSIPKGRIFATTRDELLECAALVRAIQKGQLDRIRIPPAPLDILAQQIVAAAASREWEEEELFQVFRRAAPYASLLHRDFDAVVTMLAEGISTRRGRRGAYLHRDRINGKIRARRGARLAALTSGGAIPDRADYLVKADPEETLVGTLDEDFAVESMQGDIFLLGNTSWRIRRVEAGVVRVENAGGAPPTVPFWRGEAPARTAELSQAFSEIREEILTRGSEKAQQWLKEECGLDDSGAQQAVKYVLAGKAALGALATQNRVVAERFFDESGGMQLVLHAPFGSRINRAWGLALRKRFCRSFNFELQAAATENGILLSLSDQHSFPLDSIFAFLSSKNVREVLIQALLAVPLFGTRWRWNACRALAILRFSSGRKVPPPLQRIRSDDLLASIFPEQAACLENIQGDIAVPDHPLVFETVRDCLDEAMDVDGLIGILSKIEDGDIQCVAVETSEPSPFSHEILNANAYAFLDDAPLEERRARAVQTRRTLPPQDRELGILDAQAIHQVAKEAWPPWENADELHDALLTLGVLTDTEVEHSRNLLENLVEHKRTGHVILEPIVERENQKPQEPITFWFATERMNLVRSIYPEGRIVPGLQVAERYLWEKDKDLDAEQALRELVQCRLQASGPATSSELCLLLNLPRTAIDTALQALQKDGQILSGSFRTSAGELEWCDRRLLARIHRLTLGRLRREIEPVSPAEFMRFLFRWQHLPSGTQLHDEPGLSMTLDQLQGFEAAAAAWEEFILPSRISEYVPELLDRLCLSGEFVWGRLSLPSNLEAEILNERPDSSPRGTRPSRLAPVAFFRRSEMREFFMLRKIDSGQLDQGNQPATQLHLSHPASEVLEQLQRWGACFLEDLVRTTGRLPLEVEEGLWELVAAGLATADGFDNLRFLTDPKRKRGFAHRSSGRSRLRTIKRSMGRWTLLDLPGVSSEGSGVRGQGVRGQAPNSGRILGPVPELHFLARQLLKRWGVVFRDLLARESLLPAWRDLLATYRTMEARGLVRGGRFVSGFVGEQFALPEALDALRATRRSQPTGEVLRISAADPLNLIGIITPGSRLRPHPTRFAYYRDGVPVEEESFLVSKSLSVSIAK